MSRTPSHPDFPHLNRSLVRLRAEIPEDAFTASVLGTSRSGNGIIIDDDGLILTIGYLIAEADDIWLTTHEGHEMPGHALAYDQVTGFGLVLPLGDPGAPPLPLGDGSSLAVGDELHVISHIELAPPLPVRIAALREFAGAWEYLLEQAIFTTPAHPHWSGSALVNSRGELVGLGSLLVRELTEGRESDANLFVPTDLLKPILQDLRRTGKVGRAPRPWLGLYTAEVRGVVVVAGLTEGGPAERADIREGDLIREVGNREVSSIAEFYRSVWAQGPAGTQIQLTTTRGGKPTVVKVQTRDRAELLKRPVAH